MRTETLESRIINRIERKRGDVFLRSDFKDLGGYDHVGRVLRGLVRKGRLLKVGHGLYTKAVKSPFSDNPMPPKGLTTLKEALKRVGVEVVQTPMERDHNAGQTTQETGHVVAVRGRVRRKIGYNGINLNFERSGSATTTARQGTAGAILALAKKHGVCYTKTASDAWAQNVTRLADDDVKLDAIELLLIELQRAGHLSRPEALRLQANYLREARP
ncbi:MAG: type IV toxin-antitoxin system AbiEi family antitoxin domain-containing protein [Syntrophobacteraceae bacterium]